MPHALEIALAIVAVLFIFAGLVSSYRYTLPPLHDAKTGRFRERRWWELQTEKRTKRDDLDTP